MGKILSIAVPAYNVGKIFGAMLTVVGGGGKLSKSLRCSSSTTAPSMRRRRLQSGTVRNIRRRIFYITRKTAGMDQASITVFKKATGKYFKVLDGDDWLNTKELPEFLRLLEDSDADIVAADFLCVEDETDRILQEKYCTRNEGQYASLCELSKGEVDEVIKRMRSRSAQVF